MNYYTLEEISEKLNISINSLRKKFPETAARQLAKGILLTKEGVYPNVKYYLSETEPVPFSPKQKKSDLYYTTDLENEEWVECFGFPNYLISNKARLRNKKTNRLIQGTIRKDNGYVDVHLDNSKSCRVHRLVMTSFNPVENMENLTIDHIDGNRSNNQLENLRWVTLEENISLMIQNRAELNKELTRLLQKYSYEEVLNLLKQLK